MTRLPRLKARQLVRALQRAGFQVIRIHAGETIGPGLLVAILRDAELSAEQLRDLL